MSLQPLTIADLKFLEGKQPSLFIYNWGSRAINFRILVLTREGLERYPYVSNADRTKSTAEFRLSQLPMSVIVECATDPVRRGELYIRVHMEFGEIKSMLVCQGYCYSGHELMWPPGTDEDMLSGRGRLRSVTGTDPAAGAEISETVPSNARWKLHAFRFRLVTSSDVGDRRVHVYVDDGSKVLWEVVAYDVQVASKTFDYQNIPTGYEQPVRDNIQVLTLSPDCMLFQSWRIRTITSGLFAADNYGAPQMLVEEWLEE